MKLGTRSLTFLALLLSAAPVFADFDNWYFDFYSEGSTSRQDVFVEEGRVVGSFLGTFDAGVVDGDDFVQKAVFTHEKKAGTNTVTVRWTALEENKFRGVYQDTNGTKATYTLVLLPQQSFRIEAEAPDGATMTTTGSLGTDGKIHSEAEMATAEGKIPLKFRTVVSHKDAEGAVSDPPPAASSAGTSEE